MPVPAVDVVRDQRSSRTGELEHRVDRPDQSDTIDAEGRHDGFRVEDLSARGRVRDDFVQLLLHRSGKLSVAPTGYKSRGVHDGKGRYEIHELQCGRGDCSRFVEK